MGSETGLRAGAARVCITPPVGIELSGYLLRDQPSTGIHDDLYARALVLEEGDTRLCLVACDLIGLQEESVAQVRALAAASAAVDPANILVACTHTHGGPATLFLRHCGTQEAVFQEVLLRQIAGAVKIACDSLQPARLSFGSAECHLAQCRRAGRQPDGHPYDPEVLVLRVDDANGQPIAGVANYACHAVVLGYENRQVTADFPGVVAARMEHDTGAPFLFLQGACGDLNPRVRGNFADRERAGNWLAGAVLSAFHAAAPLAAPPTLAIAAETVVLPWDEIPRAEVEAVGEQYRRELSSPDDPTRRVAAAFVAWSEATLAALESDTIPPHGRAEAQLIRVGDVYIAGAPGELFMALGREIKEGLAPGRTLVAAYANGEVGYLFTRQAATEGGYEAGTAYRYYGYYPVAPDAGERVVAAVLRLRPAVA